MFKFSLKYIGMVLIVVAVVFGVLFAQQQGWFPWLNNGYRINANVVLERIQDMSLLTTTRYNYSSIVTSERQIPGILGALYGERQVMVAVGYVVAGVDMSKISADDVSIDGEALSIRLPSPILQDCFLDEQASYIVSRDTGIFSRSAPNLDTEARRYAVQQFRNSALEGRILEEAQVQAAEVVKSFILLLGVESIRDVNITVAMPETNAPLPSSCS